MSEDNEVCETPTLTSESRNPFKTEPVMPVMPSCYQPKIIKHIGDLKKKTNTTGSECCPMDVPNSILSSCVDTCNALDTKLQESCRKVIIGVNKIRVIY